MFLKNVIVENRRSMNTLHPDMQMSLRRANTVMKIYGKKKKVLDGWMDKQESISDGCENCQRKQPCGENSEYTPYTLSFVWNPQNLLIKRRHFIFFRMDDSSDELIALCLECSEYLTNHDKKGKSFEYLWPSFVWKMLTDEKIVGSLWHGYLEVCSSEMEVLVDSCCGGNQFSSRCFY